MSKVQIRLNTMDEIKRFANKVNQVESNVDIIKGSVIYDAKSIMAVFAMGSLDGVYVEIQSKDEREIEWFNELMKEFVICEND